MAVGKLASLLIKISADGASAEKELRTLEKKMANTAKQIEKVGKTISKSITTPLTALAGVSVAAANTQVQAEAKLLNALKGREEVQKRLIAQAGELQSRTTFGDEAIIEQQAYLAALGLSEKQIGDTIEAAAQLSTALDMDLGSAVKNLAKTYGGMTGELGEGIPALKNLTKEQLQAGEAIKYVNDNYKGFAEAVAQTGAGSLVQLKNTLGDIAEQFGVILLPALQKITEKLKELAQWLQNLSPEWKKTITIIGAVAATIGPCAIAISKLVSAIKIVRLALPALKIALGTLTGPIGIVVTAVTALAGSWLIARRRMKEYEREAMALAKEQGEQEGKAKFEADLSNSIDFVKSKNLSDADLSSEIQYAIRKIAELESRGENAYNYKVVLTALTQVRNERKAELEVIEETNDALKTTENTVVKIKQELSTINVGGANLSALSAAPSINLGTFDQHLSESIGKTTAIADFREYWESLRKEAEKAHSIGEEIATAISTTFANMATALGEGLGDLFTGGEFDPGKTFLEVLGKSLQQLGAALITYATAMESFKKSLSAIFKNPGLAIIAGIAAIATGKAFVNLANTPPKLASGGLAYGPTLAVVGDNRGAASDPEVIAPLSKLRNYLGGQQLQLVGGVSFELRGDVVRAVLDRENFRLNRKG